MTETEAKNTAENVLEQLGITDMTCVEIGFAVMSDTGAHGAEASLTLFSRQNNWKPANGHIAYNIRDR